MSSKNQGGESISEDRRLIYVVDDEPMLLELARHFLEAEGYEVAVYRNPADALLAYDQGSRRPRMILTDFRMRRMDGLQFTAACRQINPDVKIALVSGSMESTDFSHVKEKPDGFLAKPYSHHQLISLVRTLVG